jgi:inner membrane protein
VTVEKISKILGAEGKYALVFKIAFIGVLILFLLYPIAMIEQLVFEREGQSKLAEENIVAMGGGEVTLAGPVLNVPFIVWVKGEKQERIRTVHYARFLPDEYSINGDARPESRNRGIYQVILFNSRLEVSGTFEKPDFSSWGIDESAVLWKDAFISVEMSDLRTLTGKVNLEWDGTEREFIVGGGNLGLFNGEIRCDISGEDAQILVCARYPRRQVPRFSSLR